MLIERTITRNSDGSLLFENRYKHDELGRFLTSEWIVPGASAGPTTRRIYDGNHHLVVLLGTEPNNTLMYVQVSSHDRGGRLLSRTAYDGAGLLLGRVEYEWGDDGGATAKAYDSNHSLQGQFRLRRTTGSLFDIADAVGGAKDATPGPTSILHRYAGKRLESTEMLFPPGQRASKRTMIYERTGGLLIRMRTLDEPTGTITVLELQWTDGESVVDPEEAFLIDCLQQ